MNEIILTNKAASHWAIFMWNGFLESTVLLVIFLVMWMVFRRKGSSQFYYGLFLLVILKAVVAFEVPLPQGWAWLLSDHRVALATRWVDAPGSPREAIPAPSVTSFPVRTGGSVSEPSAMPSPIQPRMQQPLSNPSIAATGAPALSLEAYLMLAWCGIVGLLMAVWGYRHRQCGQILKDAQPLNIQTIPVSYLQCLRNMGIQRNVPLFFSDKIASPFVKGWLYPVVVVPVVFFQSMTPKQAEWVLLHEIAHIKRKDLWVSFFQKTAQICFFFSPSVWIANRMVNRYREYACDDMALAAGGVSRKECGAILVQIAEQVYQMPDPVASTLGISQQQSMLKERLRRILDSKRVITAHLSKPALLSLCLTALVVLPYVRALDSTQNPVTVNWVDTDPVAASGNFQLSGTVLDASTQQPVPRADVNLYKSSEGFHQPPIFSTRTNEDGTFWFDALPAGIYKPLVNADGYAVYLPKAGHSTVLDPLYQIRVTPSNPHPKVKIELERGLSLPLTVISPQGTPVSNAAVFVTGSEIPLEWTVTTDENGQCVLNQLSSTPSRILVRHSNYGEVVSGIIEFGEPNIPNHLTLQMHDPASISGRMVFRDSGKPVPNNTMYLLNHEHNKGLTGMRSTEKRTTKTDENGYYQFENLGPYTYLVYVQDAEAKQEVVFDQMGDRVQLRAGEQYTGLDFEVGVHDTGSELLLKLVSTTGAAVPGAEVIANIDMDASTLSVGVFYPISVTSGKAVSDENGLVRIGGLVPFKGYGLNIDAFGYFYEPPSQHDLGGFSYPRIDGIQEIQLKPAGKISGTVVDSQNLPVPGVEVNVELETQRFSKFDYAVTNDEGVFEIASLVPGAYFVTLQAKGYTTENLNVLPVQSGKETRIEVQLDEGKSLRGNLTDSMGNPVSGAGFYLKSQAKNPNENVHGFFSPTELLPAAVSERDGSFVVNGIGRNGDVLVVEAEGYGTRRIQFNKKEIDQPMTLTLGPGAVIEGRVFDAKGRPQADAHVQIFNFPENLLTYSVPVQADGSYRLSGLSAEQFEIRKTGRLDFLLNDHEYRTLTLKEGVTYPVHFGTGEQVSITGSVINKEGSPESHAFVTLKAGGGDGFSGKTHLTTATDEEGGFSFYDVPPGTYRLSYELYTPGQFIDMSGFYSNKGKQIIEINQQNQPVNVVLSEREYSVRFSVVDALNQQPISDAWIQNAQPLNSNLPNDKRIRVNSDPNGRVDLNLKIPGEYALFVSKAGYDIHPFQIQVGGEENEHRIELVPSQRKLTASVRLGETPLTSGVPQVMMVWEKTGYALQTTPLSSGTGLFELSGLPQEPVDLMMMYTLDEDPTRWACYPQTVVVGEKQNAIHSFQLFEMLPVQFIFTSLKESQMPEDIKITIPGFTQDSKFLFASRNQHSLSYMIPKGIESVVIDMPGYRSIVLKMADYKFESKPFNETLIKVDAYPYW